jgi:hypothetical protein
MGFSKLLIYSFAAIVAFLAACWGEYLFVLRRWQSVSVLEKNDFQSANFKVHPESELPVTYYEPGKLGEVLKEVA